MRALMTKDVFAMARIITRMNIKEDLKRIAESAANGKNETEVGMDLIFTVLGGASTKESERAIYEFIAELLETTADSVAELPPEELVKVLTEVTNAEDWKRFFESAVRLIMPK